MPVNIAMTTMCGSLSQNVSPVTAKKGTVLADRQPGVSLGSKEGKPDRIGQNEQWSRRVTFAFVQTNQITTPLASVGGAAPPLQSVKNRDKLHSQETQNHEKPSSCAHQGSPDQRGNGDCRICLTENRWIKYL